MLPSVRGAPTISRMALISYTDKELEDRLKSLQAKLSDFLHSGAGRTLRILVGEGAGMIPGVGTIVSAIDSFLLEKIFPHKGAITFVNKLYPSIFRNRKGI